MLPEEIADARQRRYNGTVAWLKKPHPELMIVRVKPDFPRPPHRAGQYCSLGLGNWEPRAPGCQAEELKPSDESKVVRRAYSISNSILDETGHPIDVAATDYIEFYITLVREGSDPTKPPALTPRLFMLREGDRLNIGEKITGHYTLEPVKPGDNILFLGTGTGERRTITCSGNCSRRGHTGKILHACCVRYKKDLAYLETHRTADAAISELQISGVDHARIGHGRPQGLHSGSAHERADGRISRRAARSREDARLPVRQSEDDWRAGQEQGNGCTRLSSDRSA